MISKPPDRVHDRMLWHAAQEVLHRHWPRTGPPRYPAVARACAQCGRPWPCPPYRLAREAELLAELPRPTPTSTNPGT